MKKKISKKLSKIEDLNWKIFLEDLKMSLLNLSFFIYCIIHKMLVLLKNTLNYPKDSILECFFI